MNGSQKKLGQFFTPPEVARTLVQWVVSNPRQRLLDPSCGDGEFLAYHPRAVGIDVDRTHTLQARKFLLPERGIALYDALLQSPGVRSFSHVGHAGIGYVTAPDEITPHPPLLVQTRGSHNSLVFDQDAQSEDEQTVLGGLKTKDIDVVVTKPGIGPVVGRIYDLRFPYLATSMPALRRSEWHEASPALTCLGPEPEMRTRLGYSPRIG